jgi:hypothetical protein
VWLFIINSINERNDAGFSIKYMDCGQYKWGCFFILRVDVVNSL